MIKNLILYMGLGVAIGVLTYPWRRQLSHLIDVRLCMWMWTCFWPLLIVVFAGIGARALWRSLTRAK